MQIPVRNVEGVMVGQVEVSDVVFAASAHPDLVHQAVVHHQGNQRQGTHSTKTRGAVSGGGRKPWTQKHTGRARQGSIRSPQWRGGGVVFGPHPRSYRTALPAKMRRQAIRAILSGKVREGRLVILEDAHFADGRTKTMAQALRSLGVDSSALVVLEAPQRSVAGGLRNLPRVKGLTADLLNVLDLVRYDAVVMTKAAAERASTVLSRGVVRGLRRAPEAA